MSDDAACYDIRERELRQRIAILSRRSDDIGVVSAVQLANQTCKIRFGDGFIGDKVYLRLVAGMDIYDRPILEWATALADEAGRCHGTSGRKWMKDCRPEWSRVAAKDGFDVAVLGKVEASARARAKALGVNRVTYAFCRNFIAGALALQWHQFEVELYESVRIHGLSITE